MTSQAARKFFSTNTTLFYSLSFPLSFRLSRFITLLLTTIAIKALHTNRIHSFAFSRTAAKNTHTYSFTHTHTHTLTYSLLTPTHTHTEFFCPPPGGPALSIVPTEKIEFGINEQIENLFCKFVIHFGLVSDSCRHVCACREYFA